MKEFQRRFIHFAIEHQVLQFGEFHLKSGRVSPYFFNAGLFHSGRALATLGRFYAQALVDAMGEKNISCDLLFGPAYKGIPLVSATAMALADHHDIDTPWCFNRKEAKTHGEGGTLVGAPLQGNVAIIDDVITAGTAIRESIKLLAAYNAKPACVVISLDRQEKGEAQLSAIQEIEQNCNIPVISIISLAQIMEFVAEDASLQDYTLAIKHYRHHYGIDNLR